MATDDLPEWLDKRWWVEFVAHRRAKKKPMTPQAKKLNIAFLEQHKSDHVEIIKTSIMKGWTGLFRLTVAKNRDREPQHGSIEAMVLSSMKIGDVIDVECE